MQYSNKNCETSFQNKATSESDYDQIDIVYEIMMEKMYPNDHYFTFPKSSTKYISILLEFLLGETYISREFDAGNEVYWERIYTMPAKNEIERELGCFLSIKATGISLGCDEGGC